MSDEQRALIVERCEKSMFVIVAQEHLDAGMSARGGWSKEQFKLIGVEWPPRAGWKKSVVGRRLHGSLLAAFVRLRDSHSKKDR